MKIAKCLLLLFCVCFVFGCATTNKFIGKGDLCGFIVDENNNPISDYVVVCKGKMNMMQSTFTNESGIFVFYNLPAGKYTISGEKEGFSRLKETEYQFLQRGKIFCCQIDSIDSVLDSVEKMILLKEYKTGIELLNSLSYEMNTEEEKVITYYLDFIQKMEEEDKSNVTNEV